jgi:hypothetical protein
MDNSLSHFTSSSGPIYTNLLSLLHGRESERRSEGEREEREGRRKMECLNNVHSYLAVLLSKLVGMTSGEDKYTPLPDLVLKVMADNYSISASEVQKLAPDADATLYILFLAFLYSLSPPPLHTQIPPGPCFKGGLIITRFRLQKLKN